MIKWSVAEFRRVLDPLKCWLWKGALKGCVLESSVTKCLRVSNFRNKVAMTIIFFFKMFKIWCRFQKWKKKKFKNFFRFSSKCIWNGSCKFSQPWTGYLPSVVNVLPNIPKISPNTRGNIFRINFPENNKRTWEKGSHGNITRSSDAFTCWLSTPILKRCSWESFLTNIFTVSNFGNALAMTIIFSFKMFKICYRIQKWNKKFRKCFGFSANCIWIGSCIFSQRWTGYFPSVVSVLTNTP